MKALPLLLLPVLGQLAWGKSLCPVDEAIHEKIRDGAGPLSEDPHFHPLIPDMEQSSSQPQAEPKLHLKPHPTPVPIQLHLWQKFQTLLPLKHPSQDRTWEVMSSPLQGLSTRTWPTWAFLRRVFLSSYLQTTRAKAT